MATNFPTSIDSYTTKVNNVDTIDAANVNDLQDAMVQVETILGATSRRRTTFTPTLDFQTTSPTSVTYGANNGGYYARFGSLVFVTMRIHVTAYSGGSGNALIGTLPFTVFNNNANFWTGAVRAVSGFVTLWPAITQAVPNTTYAQLLSYTSTAAPTLLTATNLATGGFDAFMSFSYFHA
jgi:hypothetical protein